MKYGIIGAGRVGCSLGIALKHKGFSPMGVYSKSYSSSEFLSKALNVPGRNDFLTAIELADVIFITVNDSDIRKVSEYIAYEIPHELVKGKTFIHCSGVATSEELQALAEQDTVVASLHPLQTFPNKETGWVNFDNIYFSFEGDKRAIPTARQIVDGFDSRMIFLSKEDKALYHAAACILSNYTVTLANLASDIFDAIGIKKEEGIRAMMPLLKTTVDNIYKYGAIQAITGPISRGDTETVKKHLDGFGKKGVPIGQVYKQLGKRTVRIAYEKGVIDDAATLEMTQLLD